MRLAAACKKGLSLSFTFRNASSTKGYNTHEEEDYDFVLPPMVKSSLDYLTKHGGVTTEGIFRISGSMTDIEYLAKKYSKGKAVTLDSILNIHTIAGLLKYYIRNRRGGLIPTAMRPCVLAAGNITDEDTRTFCIYKTMKLLPANNKLALMKICEYLDEVQKNATVNKMDVYNLALIFASTFFPSDSSVLEHAYAQTAYALAFTETLIKHQSTIFADGESNPFGNEPVSDEAKSYIDVLKQYITTKEGSRPSNRRKKTMHGTSTGNGNTRAENNNELQKMAIMNLTRKQSGTMDGASLTPPQSPRTSSMNLNSINENAYLEIIVSEKMCRREEVDLLSKCLMLGEPELFMQHLERVSKGDSYARETIQKAAIKMCRNPRIKRKPSVE